MVMSTNLERSKSSLDNSDNLDLILFLYIIEKIECLTENNLKALLTNMKIDSIFITTLCLDTLSRNSYFINQTDNPAA